jgi:ribosomal protein S18 acetylase RimI-like enzyme
MRLRSATPGDVPAIAALVEAAYAHYVPRIGRRPAPMDADHAHAVARGDVLVADDGGALAGVLETAEYPDHLLVENVAVAPDRRGAGLGRDLLAAAEARAAALGLPELRLYTNEAMTENVELYRRLGWSETARARQDGFRRVFFVKRIARSG